MISAIDGDYPSMRQVRRELDSPARIADPAWPTEVRQTINANVEEMRLALNRPEFWDRIGKELPALHFVEREEVSAQSCGELLRLLVHHKYDVAAFMEDKDGDGTVDLHQLFDEIQAGRSRLTINPQSGRLVRSLSAVQVRLRSGSAALGQEKVLVCLKDGCGQDGDHLPECTLLPGEPPLAASRRVLAESLRLADYRHVRRRERKKPPEMQLNLQFRTDPRGVPSGLECHNRVYVVDYELAPGDPETGLRYGVDLVNARAEIEPFTVHRPF